MTEVVDLLECSECGILPELHIVPDLNEDEEPCIHFIAHCIKCDARVKFTTSYRYVEDRNTVLLRFRAERANNPVIAAWNQMFGICNCEWGEK